MINFDFKVIGLDGKEAETYNVKESVANIIASGSTSHPVRMAEIARKIFTEGKIDLLAEDLVKVRSAIESTKLMTDWVKAQVLAQLDKKEE